jgi:hypothetical protein
VGVGEVGVGEVGVGEVEELEKGRGALLQQRSHKTHGATCAWLFVCVCVCEGGGVVHNSDDAVTMAAAGATATRSTATIATPDKGLTGCTAAPEAEGCSLPAPVAPPSWRCCCIACSTADGGSLRAEDFLSLPPRILSRASSATSWVRKGACGRPIAHVCVCVCGCVKRAGGGCACATFA